MKLVFDRPKRPTHLVLQGGARKVSNRRRHCGYSLVNFGFGMSGVQRCMNQTTRRLLTASLRRPAGQFPKQTTKSPIVLGALSHKPQESSTTSDLNYTEPCRSILLVGSICCFLYRELWRKATGHPITVSNAYLISFVEKNKNVAARGDLWQ